MPTPPRAQLAERLSAEGPQGLRIVVAAVVGWLACRWIDPTTLPIYAVIVPVAAMRDDPYSALHTSFDRLLGVVAGIAIGVLVADWLGPSVYAVGLVLLTGLLGGILLRVGPALNVQVSLSALIVFASPDPGQLAVTRLWETVVGAVVTVVLSPLLFPPDPRQALTRAYEDVVAQVARHLSDLSVVVEHADRHPARLAALMASAQETEREAQDLPGKLAGARRSLRYNLLRRDQQAPLSAMAAPIELAGGLAEAVRVLVEDVAELSARTDLTATWSRVGGRLAPVLSAAAAAVGTGLPPSGLAPGARAAVTRASEEIERWRAASATPVDAVLRRPAYQIVRALAELGPDAHLDPDPHPDAETGR